MSVPKAVQRQIANGRTLQKVFQSPDGKRALYYLMQKGGLLEAEFEPGKTDYNLGRRAVVIELMQDLRYDWGRLYELSLQRVEEEGPQEL